VIAMTADDYRRLLAEPYFAAEPWTVKDYQCRLWELLDRGAIDTARLAAENPDLDRRAGQVLLWGAS
jgi:hypothetical protein